MKKKNSYLKSVLFEYPERSGVSASIVDMAFAKYKSQESIRFMALYVFALFVFFTIAQTLVRFFLSTQILNLFEDKMVIYITFAKYIANYLVQFGPIVLLFGMICTVVTIYQNKDYLK